MDLSTELYQEVVSANLSGMSKGELSKWITEHLYRKCDKFITDRLKKDTSKFIVYHTFVRCFDKWEKFCDILQQNGSIYTEFFRTFFYKKALLNSTSDTIKAFLVLDGVYGSKN